MNCLPSSKRPAAAGFTLIEVLVVLGIMSIFLVVSIPSVLNTMAVRNLENTTRQVQTFLQQAKFQAVSTKIVHRVRFSQPEGTAWVYEMERLQPDGTWIRVGTAPRRSLPVSFNITLNLPLDGGDPIAIFSPVGAMANFAVNQNSIVLQNPKLDRPGQMDERVLSLYMGGSIHYDKRKSS
jgi:prepilin-type N-terminal cleavage/methylation domain-containing protein